MQRDGGTNAGHAMHLAGIANFSAVEVAAAGCRNLPKRVPVLAKPQEGNSI